VVVTNHGRKVVVDSGAWAHRHRARLFVDGLTARQLEVSGIAAEAGG
jgi:hypothetical protein